MKKILVPAAIILCLIMASPLLSQTKKAGDKPKGASCAPCHAAISTVLPKDHKPVTGNTIAACTSCHKPDFSGKAETNAFSARLHRPHVKPDAKTDCVLCHAWTPGKQFGFKGAKENLGKVSRENMALAKKTFASWATSPYLDAKHGKANVVCNGCHGKTVPESGDTVENDRCLSCHGSLKDLADRSAPKDFPDRNPHNSHLGEIACTVCHHAHQASEVYCLGCHQKFTMKIPGGK
jgi:hypothetical protein